MKIRMYGRDFNYVNKNLHNIRGTTSLAGVLLELWSLYLNVHGNSSI